ncbi:SIMPL domain-containing protein [Candidatus Gottesmanbacteria bacterium]|nr:SIMPL domain-containing protein [Candidatus Gottesmanbacteria bacterium]
MESKSLSASVILSAVLFVALLGLGGMFLPSWGKLELTPPRTVTVVGEAKSQEKSQIAIFSAGVNAFNDDKNVAVSEVNKKVEAIISAVKEFGVSAADIKTQSMNIYQNQEQYYDADGRQKYRAGQWNVSNTVEIKLMDVDRASTLASILTKSGANNVYGPNFTFDDTSEQATALLDAAYKNAQVKAEKIAVSTGKKLGSVVSVTEAGASQQPVPYLRMEGGGGGGGAVEPGSGTVMKTVTVTFELK